MEKFIKEFVEGKHKGVEHWEQILGSDVYKVYEMWTRYGQIIEKFANHSQFSYTMNDADTKDEIKGSRVVMKHFIKSMKLCAQYMYEQGQPVEGIDLLSDEVDTYKENKEKIDSKRNYRNTNAF